MSEPTASSTTLSEWYSSERERLSSLSTRARAAVGLAVTICVAQLAVTVALFQDVYRWTWSVHSLDMIALFLWTLALALIAVAVWVRARVGAASTTDLQPVSANDIPEIADIVYRLSDKMGLPKPRISYWCSIRPGSASIVDIRTRTRLLLSVNVLIDARHRTPAVRGLLAHELAHILHGDTNVWWIVSKIAVPLRAVLAVMIGISLLVVALASSFVHGFPWNWEIRWFSTPNFVPFLTTLLLSYPVKLNQRAEVLADCAAVLATGAEDVRAALIRYVPEDDSQDVEHEQWAEGHADLFDKPHPTRTLRLARLDRFETMATLS